MRKTPCEYCYLQAKEKLTSQTEEWINMVNRQVEEEIGFYEQQAELVSNLVTGPSGVKFRELNHASNSISKLDGCKVGG